MCARGEGSLLSALLVALLLNATYGCSRSEHAPAPLEVVIGCDDAADVMVNGVRVGEVAAWRTPATFALPLDAERTLVAVKARNDGGPGGLVGALIDRDRNPLPQPAHWLCSARNEENWSLPAFDDHAWMEPDVLAPHGSQPWGVIDQALGKANWVWTENPAREHQTIYCRWWITASSSG